MENIEKLAAALVKAQSEMGIAKKDSENSFFDSTYANLGSVWKACHKALTGNGICVIQSPSFKDGHFVLTTTLLHSSGQSISGDYLIKPVKDDPQAFGSAFTYARRYSLAAMVGVMSEDDDGNAASAPKPEAKPASVPKPEAKPASVASPVGNLTATFLPAEVSQRPWSKNGKEGVAYGVKSPSGDWYSTLDEKIFERIECAKANEMEITIAYKINGRYKNIVSIKDIEVPFDYHE